MAIWSRQCVPLASNVRLAFSFLQKYTGSAPAQHDVKVMVKREGTSTWNTIYTTSSAIYNDWVPVNENISNTYFPYSNQNYTVRFVFDYQPASSSTATCCFTDCQIIAQSMGLKKVTGLGTGTLDVDNNFCNLKESGQANTPLKYYQNATGSYLLLGNYTSSTGAKYFCINAANGTKKWEYTNGAPSGYYWAGAAVVNDAAIFGDEDGKVHVVMLEPDNNGNAVEVDQDSTTPGIQPYDINTSSSAHIRTTINYYDVPGTNEDKLYVVDYDGYLYQLNYNSSTHIITSGGAGVRASGVNYSTSSPVRIDDKVFYGAGGLSVSRISGGNLQTPVSIGTGIERCSPPRWCTRQTTIITTYMSQRIQAAARPIVSITIMILLLMIGKAKPYGPSPAATSHCRALRQPTEICISAMTAAIFTPCIRPRSYPYSGRGDPARDMLFDRQFMALKQFVNWPGIA
ncbi:MAG: hypothetical protein RQM95_12330 [Syntrophaceticus schinkii]